MLTVEACQWQPSVGLDLWLGRGVGLFLLAHVGRAIIAMAILEVDKAKQDGGSLGPSLRMVEVSDYSSKG